MSSCIIAEKRTASQTLTLAAFPGSFHTTLSRLAHLFPTLTLGLVSIRRGCRCMCRRRNKLNRIPFAHLLRFLLLVLSARVFPEMRMTTSSVEVIIDQVSTKATEKNAVTCTDVQSALNYKNESCLLLLSRVWLWPIQTPSCLSR